MNLEDKPVAKVFPEEVARVKAGYCATCKKPVHPNIDFKDELSVKEYKISGMCQSCQDGVFG
jgi:hypothetical protein